MNTKMRVACLIDNLESGGAQRQLCLLAMLLRRNGLSVTLFTYYPGNFFLSNLSNAGIQFACLHEPSPFKRIAAFRKALRKNDFDVVLSYLQTPNLLAEIAAIPQKKWGLVVSERNSYINKNRYQLIWRYLAHGVADYIVTNSHTNRLLLAQRAPWLRDRLATIYNCVDMEHFSPKRGKTERNVCKFIGVGRLASQKNLLGLIDAFFMVISKLPMIEISLDWYGAYFDKGSDTKEPSIYHRALKKVADLGLKKHIRFHCPTEKINDVYRNSSALILPSFFEGLPNVVCEAMACGRPILMSRNCDSGNLVRRNLNGFVFDPCSSRDIAEKIMRFYNLPESEKTKMGEYSRTFAEKMFDQNEFAFRYLELMRAASVHKKIQIKNWPACVPASACETVRGL